MLSLVVTVENNSGTVFRKMVVGGGWKIGWTSTLPNMNQFEAERRRRLRSQEDESYEATQLEAEVDDREIGQSKVRQRVHPNVKVKIS